MNEDFELKVLIKEDGMDILLNDVPVTNKTVPYGRHYSMSDINLLKITGQWGQVQCHEAGRDSFHHKSARS